MPPLVVASLLLLLPAGAEGVPADEASIRALYDRWFAAMESGDVDGLLALVTDDIVIKVPGAPEIVGKAAVEQTLRQFHAGRSERVEFEVVEVGVDGDLAFARIHERATIREKGGEPIGTFEGTHLTILRRGADGRWRVARDVGSFDAPLP